MTQERLCANCSFFASSNAEATPTEGDCRRYAPRPVSDRRETMWITVSGTDWCGDFAPRG